LPLSSLRVSYSLREDSRDLLPHLVTREDGIVSHVVDAEERLTKPIRSAPGCFLTYSVRVPFGMYSDTNCKCFVETPMNGTMFGCLNLFHKTASLKNDCGARRWVFFSSAEWSCRYRVQTNLRNGLAIFHGHPQALDTHFPAAVGAFPHIGEATVGDRVTTNFDKIVGCVV